MAEAMKKTTIRLPKSLWQDARKRGIDEGRDFQDLVSDALAAYLRTPLKKAAR